MAVRQGAVSSHAGTRGSEGAAAPLPYNSVGEKGSRNNALFNEICKNQSNHWPVTFNKFKTSKLLTIFSQE